MAPSNRGRARRELGQNFLVDDVVLNRIVNLLEPPGQTPIVELGAGNGSLTRHLVAVGHRVTAVEIDPVWVASLRRRCPGARVINSDMLTFRFPRCEHVVVGNLPYASTTAMTRRLLAESAWVHCVLLLQWEVARKRAGGGNMLNAQWSPWYRFELRGRVAARSFRPVPSVDGGLLVIRRREHALVADSERKPYQDLVQSVFTGRGRGVAGIVRRLTGRHVRFPPTALPKDLTAEDWAWLYHHCAR